MDRSEIRVRCAPFDDFSIRRMVAREHGVNDGQAVAYDAALRLTEESIALAKAQMHITDIGLKAGISGWPDQ